MYMIKTAKNPSGNTVIFNEDKHTYKVKETRQRLKSCTKFIKMFTPEFDDDYFSKKKAKDLGIPQEDVLEMWEKKRVRSTDLGTAVHEWAEAYLLNEELPKPRNNRVKRRIETLKPIIEYLANEFVFIDSEKIIFSEKLGISGTIDLLMKKDNTIYIFDWKTNKEIKKVNNWGNKMLEPIEHLDDCNLIHYMLQLNIYKKILIEENYFPKNTKFSMCIFHITDEDVIPYHIEHMDYEIRKMLRTL